MSARRLTRASITLFAAMVVPVFPAGGQTINEDVKLLADDGAGFDLFGFSVAISGDTVVIGVVGDNMTGFDSGSAYLFDATTGQQTAKLLANVGFEFGDFGFSVAIDGNTAVVGARFATANGVSSGAAYLFDTTTRQQLAKLVPNDGAAGDQFGRSVAISGDTVIVGARFAVINGDTSGAAYLFDTATGQQTAKLVPNDETASFGNSVAISGNAAVVGAFGDTDNGPLSGSAYIFNTTTGQQLAKLLPDDGAPFDQFGRSVAMSGDTAVIAAEDAVTTVLSPGPHTSSTLRPVGKSPSSCPMTGHWVMRSVTP